jgi:glycerol dehydrogenase-like iron-containing ADH family enzyme
MDGIVSNSSSMVHNGIKSTLYTGSPVAVIADMKSCGTHR